MSARDIDRRALIRMGATVSGAALAAALPAFSAIAEPKPEDPIIGLWAERNRVLDVGHRFSDESLAAIDAGYGEDVWGPPDKAANRAWDEVHALEGRIMDLIPMSPEGWRIQATLMLASFVDGSRSDGRDEQMIRNWIEHFGRMAGLASDAQETRPIVPARIAQSEPLARASREELLTRYNCWLAFEHQRLAEEMYPSMEEAWRYIPNDRAAMTFHWPIPRNGTREGGSSPSERALAVLTLAGVFTGPNADFDPVKWREGGGA